MRTFSNETGQTATAKDEVEANFLLSYGYTETLASAQSGAATVTIAPPAPPVPHLGTIVVFRHPGGVYTKGQDYYVPAIVLGSNSDGTVNLWAFSIHSLAPELGVAYGPLVGQYQSQDEAVTEMAARAEAKAQADALAAKVAKDFADKRAAE